MHFHGSPNEIEAALSRLVGCNKSYQLDTVVLINAFQIDKAKINEGALVNFK